MSRETSWPNAWPKVAAQEREDEQRGEARPLYDAASMHEAFDDGYEAGREAMREEAAAAVDACKGSVVQRRERVIRIWVWERDHEHYPWCNSLTATRWTTREAAVSHGLSIAFRRMLKEGPPPVSLRFEVISGKPDQSGAKEGTSDG
jgi:hypothetical protein